MTSDDNNIPHNTMFLFLITLLFKFQTTYLFKNIFVTKDKLKHCDWLLSKWVRWTQHW